GSGACLSNKRLLSLALSLRLLCHDACNSNRIPSLTGKHTSTENPTDPVNSLFHDVTFDARPMSLSMAGGARGISAAIHFCRVNKPCYIANSQSLSYSFA